MLNLDSPKKPAPQDWSSHYLLYRLKEAGTNFTRLSREHGYSPTAAAVTARHPWPRMEKLIAAAIGVAPQIIWPSRYLADGTPKRHRGERVGGRFSHKDSTRATRANAKSRGAN